jgi:arylsulfatase A-like enzyme
VPADRMIAAELLRGKGTRAGIEGDWKYIFDGNRPDRSALFELARDPDEKRNVATRYPQQAERFQQWLTAFAAANQEAKSAPVHTDITAEQLEAIKALGYVR